MAKRWDRTDQVLVLKLYTELPFGQMDARNVEVKNLANLLDRSPNSVAMKLANYASLDETLNRKGLDGATKADRATWAEFLANIDEFLSMAERMLSALEGDYDYETSERFEDKSVREGKTAERTVETRTNQNVFRRMVLSSYDNRCGATGLAESALLIASHIVPWAVSKESRLDPRNGICLNSLHDKAFDRGFITFRDDLRMVCSKKLIVPNGMRQYFNEEITLKPNKFSPAPAFLQYHRDVCFASAA